MYSSVGEAEYNYMTLVPCTQCKGWTDQHDRDCPKERWKDAVVLVRTEFKPNKELARKIVEDMKEKKEDEIQAARVNAIIVPTLQEVQEYIESLEDYLDWMANYLMESETASDQSRLNTCQIVLKSWKYRSGPRVNFKEVLDHLMKT